jgi:hypothetical protein
MNVHRETALTFSANISRDGRGSKDASCVGARDKDVGCGSVATEQGDGLVTFSLYSRCVFSGGAGGSSEDLRFLSFAERVIFRSRQRQMRARGKIYNRTESGGWKTILANLLKLVKISPVMTSKIDFRPKLVNHIPFELFESFLGLQSASAKTHQRISQCRVKPTYVLYSMS